jgi:hypothetical protein
VTPQRGTSEAYNVSLWAHGTFSPSNGVAWKGGEQQIGGAVRPVTAESWEHYVFRCPIQYSPVHLSTAVQYRPVRTERKEAGGWQNTVRVAKSRGWQVWLQLAVSGQQRPMQG